jgi:hypothetical protein
LKALLTLAEYKVHFNKKVADKESATSAIFYLYITKANDGKADAFHMSRNKDSNIITFDEISIMPDEIFVVCDEQFQFSKTLEIWKKL